jgi:hypothetical protein
MESSCWINAFSPSTAVWQTAVWQTALWQLLSMEASPLPFVIPSAAEGSAVPRTIPGNVFHRAQRLRLTPNFRWVQNRRPDLVLAKLSLWNQLTNGSNTLAFSLIWTALPENSRTQSWVVSRKRFKSRRDG